MDKDGAEADAGEEDDVINHGGPEVLRLHGGAAIVDHDGLAVALLDESGGQLRSRWRSW